MIRHVLVALLWGAVLGCSILPSSGPVPDLYTLTATPSAGLDPVEWPLAIEEPVPTGGLGTDRIAVRPSPLELRYFSKVRWAERVPRMVQTLLIQSFQDSGAFPAVTRQPIGLHRGHSLRTELRAFEVEKFAKGQAPLVRVAITAQLVTLPREEIVATKTWEARRVAQGSEMVAVVAAFDEALDAVVAEMLTWVAGQTVP
jgi:cholesterol transport system auxiliary component